MKRCKATGKIRYRDSIAAKIALAFAPLRRHTRRPKDEVRYYRCPDCRGFHLTSERFRPSRRRVA